MKLFLAFGTTNSEVLDNDNNVNMSFYTYSIKPISHFGVRK